VLSRSEEDGGGARQKEPARLLCLPALFSDETPLGDAFRAFAVNEAWSCVLETSL
jgi:hypothetical protein